MGIDLLSLHVEHLALLEPGTRELCDLMRRRDVAQDECEVMRVIAHELPAPTSRVRKVDATVRARQPERATQAPIRRAHRSVQRRSPRSSVEGERIERVGRESEEPTGGGDPAYFLQDPPAVV